MFGDAYTDRVFNYFIAGSLLFMNVVFYLLGIHMWNKKRREGRDTVLPKRWWRPFMDLAPIVAIGLTVWCFFLDIKETIHLLMVILLLMIGHMKFSTFHQCSASNSPDKYRE